MFEGIILVIFFIVGGLASLLALFFFVFALLQRSKPMFRFGLFTAIIPVSLYGLTYWYYYINIPSLNRTEENRYIGTYRSDTGKEITEDGLPDKKSFKLVLYSDNTFELEENEYMNFHGKGNWRAGGTDGGLFEFKKENFIVFWATPHNSNRLEVERGNYKITFYKN